MKIELIDTRIVIRRARDTQKAMYYDCKAKISDAQDLIELFSPENACSFLGITLRQPEEIPSNSSQFDVAGLLDRDKCEISVARKFTVP